MTMNDLKLFYLAFEEEKIVMRALHRRWPCTPRMFKSETTNDETKAFLQQSAHVQFKGNANAMGLTTKEFLYGCFGDTFYLKEHSFAFHSAMDRFYRKS